MRHSCTCRSGFSKLSVADEGWDSQSLGVADAACIMGRVAARTTEIFQGEDFWRLCLAQHVVHLQQVFQTIDHIHKAKTRKQCTCFESILSFISPTWLSLAARKGIERRGKHVQWNSLSSWFPIQFLVSNANASIHNKPLVSSGCHGDVMCQYLIFPFRPGVGFLESPAQAVLIQTENDPDTKLNWGDGLHCGQLRITSLRIYAQKHKPKSLSKQAAC